jgi:hypothetical protein
MIEILMRQLISLTKDIEKIYQMERLITSVEQK